MLLLKMEGLKNIDHLNSLVIYTLSFIRKWAVQGAITVDISENPSADGADEGEGVDDQAIKVFNIVDTFCLQEQPAFD
ncbi:hypothetical protein IEQ34_026958 [Dendrobium chrysotoxum]|uniref:TCTP domain-containing protein n=1 Tax=Dendrobium chrysotoxum TaxID=161865 RepID=A0AAV7FIE1_DENCH|nr:hypothetical protein IEQ34_026958 [Dendrobium chrysotoxum]